MKQIRHLLRTSYRAHQDKQDTVLIITGNEGIGKSNLLLDIIEEWEKITGEHFTIDNVGLNQEQWIHAISIAKKTVGIAPFDEAGDGLLSRDAMSDFNRDVVKMYIVIRGLSLLTVLVLPSFWYLDKFFRMHRVKGLFFVYSRGKVAFWNKKQIKKIIMKGDDNQDVWVAKPSFRDSFPLYTGHLREGYEIRKAEKIAAVTKAMEEKYAKGEKTLTDHEKDAYMLRKQGKTLKEIAVELETSVGNIGNRLARVKSKGVSI